MTKGVLIFIIGSTNNPVMSHVPYNRERAPKENQLHDGIVN